MMTGKRGVVKVFCTSVLAISGRAWERSSGRRTIDKVPSRITIRISVLVNERKDAGVHEVRFDGSNLASGVYFYRLQAGDFVQAKRLVIVK